MEEYIRSQIETNELILSGSIRNDEIDRFSKSDLRWAKNRRGNSHKRVVRKGHVYQFDFGKNFIPEMSYEHRGLVLECKKKMLYVLPIFSYHPGKHLDVYHPIDYPHSKSDLFLLKGSEFSFLRHDSVLKLNDMRSVSVDRILYHQTGMIDPSSATFQKITDLVLQKYFFDHYHEYIQLKEQKAALEAQIQMFSSEIY